MGALPHPGVADELAGPVSEQVDEQLEDEDEAEGHVEVVGHQPQPRRRPARHAIQHRGGFGGVAAGAVTGVSVGHQPQPRARPARRGCREA